MTHRRRKKPDSLQILGVVLFWGVIGLGIYIVASDKEVQREWRQSGLGIIHG